MSTPMEVTFHNPHIRTPLSPPPDEHLLEEATSGYHPATTAPPSLETLLSGLSRAPFSRVSFMGFLKSIHCSENLEFLISSNQYVLTTRSFEQQGGSDPAHFDFVQQERKQLWRHIFSQFISHDSPKEVNIPSELKTQLQDHHHNGTLPQVELIETTMITIKDLLRDTYFQFISHVKKSMVPHELNPTTLNTVDDRVNRDYSLLPTPVDEPLVIPGFRRLSENCSPLERESFSNYGSHRAQSPLSEVLTHTRSNSSTGVGTPFTESRDSATTEIPRSVNGPYGSSSEDVSRSRSKTSSTLTNEASSGLKKIAGKFRWRRMSSNSSTSSN